MSLEDKIDQLKGAVKEGVGKISGDVKAEKEGAAEQATAKAKEVAEDAKKAAEEAAEKASAKAKEVAGNVKDAVEGTIDGVKNILNKKKKYFCNKPPLPFLGGGLFSVSFSVSESKLKNRPPAGTVPARSADSMPRGAGLCIHSGTARRIRNGTAS